jgi:hypothetical protein
MPEVGGGADVRGPAISQRKKKKKGRGRAGPQAWLGGPSGLQKMKRRRWPGRREGRLGWKRTKGEGGKRICVFSIFSNSFTNF